METIDVVGIKQTMRMLEQGQLCEVFAARDSDYFVIRPLIAMADTKKVPVTYVDTRRELGRMCGIGIGAAAAGRRRATLV